MTWENQQTGQHLSVFFCPEAWYTIYRKVKAGPAPEEPARRALLRRRVLFGNQFLKGRIAGAALVPTRGLAAQKPPARLAPAASGKPFPKRQNRGHGACPLLGAWRPKSRLRVLPLPQAASGAFFPRRRSDSPQSAWPCRRFCACGWPFGGRRSSSCC